jgi:NDP-sugar pyrophosphorylase family protein
LDIQNIQGVILAGGLGTRLRPAVADRPKVLAPVAGRPFLARLLDQLAEAGVRSVILCTGYRGDAVSAEFGWEYRGVALKYSCESEPLGTGGALRLARPSMQSDPVLVLNGDSYCEADIAGVFAEHQRRRANVSVVVAEMEDTSRYGRVVFDASGVISQFAEKSADSGSGWINAGIYILSQQFLVELPDDKPLSLERDIFPAWIGRGLYAARTSGRFIDIGTPESYRAADEFFAKVQ